MVKRIFNWISTVLLVLFVVLAILLVGVRLLGFTPFNVISGSMTPKYQFGDLVYVKNVSPEKLEKGDVITFVIGDDKVNTHRIDGVDRKERCFFTKGDANESRDGNPVLYENVVGKVCFSIPKLGYLSDYIQTRQGKYVVIMSFCVLGLLFILPELFSKQSNTKPKKKANSVENVEDSEDKEEIS